MAATADSWRPLLQRGRWFVALPEPRQTELLCRATVRELPAGTTLFLRGDANDGLYCVLDGAVRIGAVSAGDRDAVLGLIEPPQWFGEIAFFDNGPRTHDASARTASTVLHVPQGVMSQMLAAEPLWWRHLGELLAQRVRALFAGIEDLTVLPAPGRVARRLLAMAEGYGMLAPGLALRTVSVNQEQLGAMLSLTRQTVSEVLRDFETRGWVKRHYGVIELLDWGALAQVGRK